ncbi:hypothetical protein EJP77_09220 [Paenibacillus zeisoli]|uniref:Uncharacterized protein n=1 Tax=Paenibacillus zeisoli TaxID=2496267 RepID=A0A433XBQ8_9BACL|nr:hypothetical protein [Paenibacillus zeisoli]RUT31571.1 hypothetical protein EJP77_09220 [Paenibacillus zeisoli]
MHPYFMEKRYESEQQRLDRINRTEWMMHRPKEPRRRTWLSFFARRGLLRNQPLCTEATREQPEMKTRPSL